MVDNPAFTPLVIIWGAILGLVFIISLFKYLSRRSKYRLLEKLAEKGQSLTPEMMAGIANGHDRANAADKNPIASGIFLMCIGVALAIFFWAFEGGGVPFANGNWFIVIGIFPFMVGLARVLGAAFERRDPDK
jgi:lipopolysaccharide export LptBFGC system permease protein LptF